MKVKVFTLSSARKLEEQINIFTSRRDITIVDIKLSTSFLEYAALIMYEEKSRYKK